MCSPGGEDGPGREGQAQGSSGGGRYCSFGPGVFCWTGGGWDCAGIPIGLSALESSDRRPVFTCSSLHSGQQRPRGQSWEDSLVFKALVYFASCDEVASTVKRSVICRSQQVVKNTYKHSNALIFSTISGSLVVFISLTFFSMGSSIAVIVLTVS